jgi:phosphatidylserine/phosphatidylglycerophosphate/cardiolipin synthase-like enzyme
MNALRSLIGGFSVLGFCFALSASAQTLDKLYVNNVASPHLQLIEGAKSTIEIESYTMKDTQVFEALKRAMTRGVKLSIVQEPTPFGDPCQIFTPSTSADDVKCSEMKKFYRYVKSHGGTYVAFDKSRCGGGGGNCFQHGKILIADSNLMLMSTGNFNPSNLCDISENPPLCNRDFTVVTRDPTVIKAVQALVRADTSGAAIDVARVAGAAKGRLTVSPYSLAPLVRFIDSAKKTIQLENQYLRDPTFNAALVRAAKRGVKVFIMVSSACAFGRPDDSAIEKWNEIYGEFDAAGIHTKTFNASIPINGRSGYLHSKAILVDSAVAWVGSVNGSTTSLTLNREYGLFTNDPTFVRDLGTVLYSDFMEKNAETWKQSLQCKKDNRRPDDPDGN